MLVTDDLRGLLVIGEDGMWVIINPLGDRSDQWSRSTWQILHISNGKFSRAGQVKIIDGWRLVASDFHEMVPGKLSKLSYITCLYPEQLNESK